MSDEYEYQPGRWPDLSVPRRYEHLVALARRRLVGHEHHAEDAVSRALIRWAQLSPDLSPVARLERVIASEANSILRSESRLRCREERSARDRALPSRTSGDAGEVDRILISIVIGQSLAGSKSTEADAEVRILDNLHAGLSVADICRRHNYSRYYVNQIRRRWRVLLRPAFGVAGSG